MNNDLIIKEKEKGDGFSKTSFAEACIIIINFLKTNPDQIYSPNNISIKTGLHRQTVEKVINFMQEIQKTFFENFELDIEEMSNKRKVIGISNRHKLSDYPIAVQIDRAIKAFPDTNKEEIKKLFASQIQQH
jgi:hypothetical protein